MYIKNGIAFAGEQTQPLKVSGVRPLDDYKLWLRFSNGEAKIFDFKDDIKSPAFSPLQDIDVFNAVYIDYGCPCWNDGSIDIAPEYLYKKAVAVDDADDELCRDMYNDYLNSPDKGDFVPFSDVLEEHGIGIDEL